MITNTLAHLRIGTNYDFRFAKLDERLLGNLQDEFGRLRFGQQGIDAAVVAGLNGWLNRFWEKDVLESIRAVPDVLTATTPSAVDAAGTPKVFQYPRWHL